MSRWDNAYSRLGGSMNFSNRVVISCPAYKDGGSMAGGLKDWDSNVGLIVE